ncbi:Post-GPI attachment to proteins factor 3 [Mactra antiquata]
MELVIILAVLLIGCNITMVTASVGDRSYIYQKCLHNCNNVNCTEENLKKFVQSQPISHSLLQWSCLDECKYVCMWKTVDAFQKDGMPIPQFHGKWPFVRLYGIQEPASMIFSIFNGLSHLSIFYYRKMVPSYTPMYYIWHGASVISMHAWFWSTIFHSKDTDFTEKMDYFCAFSMVIATVFTLACRVLGTVKWYRPAIVGVCCFLFYIQHICYLTFTKFDYGYNMKVNIGVAIIGMLGWISWCITKRRYKYVYKAIISVLGVQLLLLLELGDFPPIWWTFDAHALWHAGSWPFALLWYSFMVDDGLYMIENKQKHILPEKID